MKKLKKCFFAFLFLITLTPPCPAQSNAADHAPFLLPQTLFVGDSGRLVVPLGQEFSDLEPFVWESFEKLRSTAELEILRVELERRGGQTRLLIDFIPYAPGSLTFPPIELPFTSPSIEASEEGPLVISDLTIHIASILNPARMSLAEAASPLALPGTSLLIYGTLGLILVILFIGVGGSVWGRRHFGDIWEKLRRRHLLRNKIAFLRRLRYECEHNKKESPGFYLSLLSGELREFLSLFTRINCHSLSAVEFLELPLGFPDSGNFSWQDDLCSIFRNWDILRFSGMDIKMTDMMQALTETGKFIMALDKAERERPIFKLEDSGNDEASGFPESIVAGDIS